jgi:hypothetical protein
VISKQEDTVIGVNTAHAGITRKRIAAFRNQLAACGPTPHSRLTVVAGTVTGSPASRPAIRPRFRLSSPAPFALPKITSSITPPARCGWRSSRALITYEARSSGRTPAQRAVESAERGPHRVIQVRGCHDHSRSCGGEALKCGRTCQGIGRRQPCRRVPFRR